MSRYKIIVNEVREEEQDELDAERMKEENISTFDHVIDMSAYMKMIYHIWVPTHFGFVRIYREFDGVKSVRISSSDYQKTKVLLSPGLLRQFEAGELIVF